MIPPVVPMMVRSRTSLHPREGGLPCSFTRSRIQYIRSSLAARDRDILGILDEVSHAEALDLACRTLVGALLAARPRFEDSTKDQACYNTLCLQAEQWVKRELKPLRFRDAKRKLIG